MLWWMEWEPELEECEAPSYHRYSGNWQSRSHRGRFRNSIARHCNIDCRQRHRDRETMSCHKREPQGRGNDETDKARVVSISAQNNECSKVYVPALVPLEIHKDRVPLVCTIENVGNLARSRSSSMHN